MAPTVEEQETRKELAEKVYALVPRVLDLHFRKSKGFTAKLEKEAGRVLYTLWDYDSTFDYTTLEALTQAYKTLEKKVVKAEGSPMGEPRAHTKAFADCLPSIASRVYALRGKHYQGCGFYWSMVKVLGTLLEVAHEPLTFESDMFRRLTRMSLREDLTAAEKEGQAEARLKRAEEDIKGLL